MMLMFGISLNKIFNFIFVMSISFILFTMFIGMQNTDYKDGFSKNKDITTFMNSDQAQNSSKTSKVTLKNNFFELQVLNSKNCFEFKSKLNPQDIIQKLEKPPIHLFS